MSANFFLTTVDTLPSQRLCKTLSKWRKAIKGGVWRAVRKLLADGACPLVSAKWPPWSDLKRFLVISSIVLSERTILKHAVQTFIVTSTFQPNSLKSTNIQIRSPPPPSPKCTVEGPQIILVVELPLLTPHLFIFLSLFIMLCSCCKHNQFVWGSCHKKIE